MVSRKLGIYGLISAAAIVSGIMAGCGGSSASVQGLGGTVTTTGGITTAPGTTTTSTSSSSAPQQVQVTTSSGVITGTLPPGESITAGQNVATIPPGVPIIQGLTLTKFNGHEKTPAPSTSAKPTTGAQGSVYVDGQNTGLTVDSQGDLSGYLILTAGNHVVTAYGPFSIVGGSVFAPTELTIGVFNFGVVVGADGIPSIPSNLNIKLPTNGGSWAHGPFVTVTYPTPDFATSSGTLIIVVDSARTIQEGRQFANGVATYYSLGASLINHNVPSGGVESVTFNVH
jgi:hypothetical protein